MLINPTLWWHTDILSTKLKEKNTIFYITVEPAQQIYITSRLLALGINTKITEFEVPSPNYSSTLRILVESLIG